MQYIVSENGYNLVSKNEYNLVSGAGNFVILAFFRSKYASHDPKMTLID